MVQMCTLVSGSGVMFCSSLRPKISATVRTLTILYGTETGNRASLAKSIAGSARERGLVAGGLLIGVVIDGGKPEYEQGDFLVRGVLGAESESGSLVVGAPGAPGQVVRLHARDARSADEDLHQALKLRVQALAGERPAGALVFTCNGRGSGMFGIPDHDVEAIDYELGGAPSAGFFAAGEIGPVAVRSFLHRFTETLAVFPQGS